MNTNKITSVNLGVVHVVQSQPLTTPVNLVVETLVEDLLRPSSELREAVEFFIRDLQGRVR